MTVLHIITVHEMEAYQLCLRDTDESLAVYTGKPGNTHTPIESTSCSLGYQPYLTPSQQIYLSLKNNSSNI